MASRVPPLLRGLVDDASAVPPGTTSFGEVAAGYRRHRAAWYADLVGCLQIPAAEVDSLARELNGPDTAERIPVALVGDRAALRRAFAVLPDTVSVRQVESAVAKRGEDPLPGLHDFVELVKGRSITAYAEVPLTWGLLGALDALAEARVAGVPVAAKFRTGGLAAELFPTPVELAAVICACRDRDLPFKLTSGLQWAIRHTDPETGLVHHGFLNILTAAAIAAEGGEPADLADILGSLDPLPVIEAVRARLTQDRTLWTGFASVVIEEPLADLATLGILREPA